MTSRSREVILPLCSCDNSPGLLHPVLEPPTQGHGVVGASPEVGHKDDKRAGALPMDRLRELGLFSLETRRL